MSKKEQIAYPFFIVADGWFQTSNYGMATYNPAGLQTLPINLHAREIELKLITDDIREAMNKIASEKAAAIRKYKHQMAYEYNDRYSSDFYYRKKMYRARDSYDAHLKTLRDTAQSKNFTAIETSKGEIYIPLPLIQVSRIFAYAARGQIIKIKCAQDASVKVKRVAGLKPTPPKLKARMR